MYWETLPSWFWAFFYLCIFLTIGTGIFNVIRQRMLVMSIVAIVLAITVPITGFLNSVGREIDTNEFEHLVIQLQKGSIWSIYVVFGCLYLAVFHFKNLIPNGISKSQKL